MRRFGLYAFWDGWDVWVAVAVAVVAATVATTASRGHAIARPFGLGQYGCTRASSMQSAIFTYDSFDVEVTDPLSAMNAL